MTPHVCCYVCQHAAADEAAKAQGGIDSSESAGTGVHTAAQQAIQSVGVTGVAPHSVTQFVPTQLTVELNTSLCGVLAEVRPAALLQLNMHCQPNGALAHVWRCMHGQQLHVGSNAPAMAHQHCSNFARVQRLA